MSNQDQTKEKSKFKLQSWRKIYAYVIRHKTVFYRLFCFNLGLAVCDILHPLLTNYAMKNFIENKNFENIYPFIAFCILFTFMFTFIISNFLKAAGSLETSVVHDIRKDAFEKIQKLSFSYFDKTAVGWIMARVTSDAHKIGDTVAWAMIDIVWCLVYIISIYVVMYIVNPTLAMIAIAAVPILLFLSILFRPKILKMNRDVRKMNSQISASLNESIDGVRTTKTLNIEKSNLEDFQILTSRMKKKSVSVMIFRSVYWVAIFFTAYVPLTIILAKGGYDVKSGLLPISDLILLITYTNIALDPLSELVNIFSEIQSAQASAERVFELLEQKEDIKDSKEVIEKYGDMMNPKYENWEEINGEIEFRDVSFSYSVGDKTELLKNFNLKIKAGERIALVGETGAGKSTIVNLACRFYEPTSGEILLDGTGYKERSQSFLHSNLAYVLQTPHLFSGSVKDNIRYGKENASDEEIFEAARRVSAFDFITKLENGFDTEVGEGGGRLSAGERQLVSFARAIIRDPRLFVLDEPTSSIDTETEMVIQGAIEEILEGRTSIIVAHRLSTVRSADRILVIDDGEIKEQGSHKELIDKKAIYFNLYANQLL